MVFKKNQKGFTLVEMLVVIAIIAILVAIIVPTVSSATVKARYATDAANLRSILSVANIKLVSEDVDIAATTAAMTTFKCASFPGAKAYIYYENPGFIIAYFENGSNRYTIDSFAEAAESGNAPIAVNLPTGGTAYPVGGST